MRTLVLDQGFQPHRIVPWQRAVVLMFCGKAVVVEEYDELVRSPRIAIRMPAVVRLVSGVRPRKQAIKFSRFNVMLRDGFTCQYCLTRLPMQGLTYDHVVPRTRGGRTCWENIVTACYDCNARKGDRTPEQAGMTLHSRPAKPTWLPLTSLHVTEAALVPDPWKSWVPRMAHLRA